MLSHQLITLPKAWLRERKSLVDPPCRSMTVHPSQAMMTQTSNQYSWPQSMCTILTLTSLRRIMLNLTSRMNKSQVSNKKSPRSTLTKLCMRISSMKIRWTVLIYKSLIRIRANWCFREQRCATFTNKKSNSNSNSILMSSISLVLEPLKWTNSPG